MRKTSFVALTLAGALVLPAPARAWGLNGHRLIMARAVDLLPPELKPFFERFREEIVTRVVDPDLWRNVGWDEAPNHFVDFGLPALGPYPFAGLPRDYTQAVEKFGMAEMRRIGLLPWREAEMFGNLRRGFEGFTRQAPYAASDVVLFSAVASHYIQDAHQPLHATNNYDGQLTGNVGIHARFESDLLERFESRLTLTPGAPKAMLNPRDAAFEILLDSYKLVEPILKADAEAAAGKEVYDDDYFEKLLAGTKPILDQQLSRSIAATTGMILGAWEAAGRPVLKTEAARRVQRVRR